MSNVIVVGGGAAGMMAAVFAARNGQNVQLLEKNEKLGKKLFITGKGRCNITNAADIEDLFTAVTSNPKFLYSGFYSFTNQQVIDFFEELGVKTKIERGERVFPVSDHSSDVIAAFSRELKSLGVAVSLHTEVRELLCEQDKVCGVLLTNGKKMKADAVIVATGGISYPSTGSITCTDGSQTMVCERIAGIISSKYRNLYHRWEEKTLRRIRRNAFYTLWCNRTGYSEREQCGGKNFKKKRTYTSYRLKTGIE